MNRTSEGTPPGVLPTAGSALDDAALSGPGSYLHGAVVVDSRPTLLAVALPYLEQGLSVGDLTVLSCAPETVELVRRELGVRARGLEADPGLTLLGTRSADVFTHLRQYAHRAGLGGSSRLRVLAEVASPADPRAQHEEMRVESVANRIMAELPVTALCVYDARRLPGELVASARETHPYLVDGASWTASPALRDPDSFVRALPVPREPLEDTPPLIAVEAAPTLPELRHRLTGPLTALVGDEEQCEDLKLGISEVAANAFRHGRRPVSGRLWSDARRLVCAITDSGTSFDDPLAGFVPAHGFDLGRGGMGLWLARKLFDHVDLFARPTGFTVRLSTELR